MDCTTFTLTYCIGSLHLHFVTMPFCFDTYFLPCTLCSLHHHLIEHMNAEIVLHTITDVSVALEWLRSTFFYIRVKKNPQHYGLPQEQEKKEEKLQRKILIVGSLGN